MVIHLPVVTDFGPRAGKPRGVVLIAHKFRSDTGEEVFFWNWVSGPDGLVKGEWEWRWDDDAKEFFINLSSPTAIQYASVWGGWDRPQYAAAPYEPWFGQAHGSGLVVLQPALDAHPAPERYTWRK